MVDIVDDVSNETSYKDVNLRVKTWATLYLSQF